MRKMFSGRRQNAGDSNPTVKRLRWELRLCIAIALPLLAAMTTSTHAQLTLIGPVATQVAAGGAHSCMLDTDGIVRCWGANSSGELGDGTTTDRRAPIIVTGLPGIVAVAAGAAHTCALDGAGNVHCWGTNLSGQLGDGTTTSSLTPVTVQGLTNVAAIAAGREHTCALTSAGAVWCWGRNDDGQLGNAASTNSAAPVQVSGLDKSALAIAAGGAHTCARDNKSIVKCWGRNDHGQLGNGTTAASKVPVKVGGSFATIATGANHTCGTANDGGLSCWGANDKGQLGDGTTTDRNVPTPVSGQSSGGFGSPPSYLGVASLGADFTCAQPTSCFGNNASHQLGNGTTTNSSVPVNAVGDAFVSTKLASGVAHTCGIWTQGLVRCWGNNARGQLGNGAAAPATAVAVDGLASYRTPPAIASVATGGSPMALDEPYPISCAVLSDGGVRCFGVSLGVSYPDSWFESGVRAVSASPYNICMIVAPTNGLFCGGLNNDGQLGDGTKVSQANYISVVGLESGVASVSMGIPLYGVSKSICALTSAGGVYCWGGGPVGRGGNVLVPGPVTGLESGAISLSLGDRTACAVTVSGGAKCWGDADPGMLGNGMSSGYSNTPVDVSGLTSGVAAISVGLIHACALTLDGRVYCWGSNYYGFLGSDAVPVGPEKFSAVPVLLTGMPQVKAISTGTFSSCALTVDETVWCWGSPIWGQRGDGLTSTSSTPTRVWNLDNVIQISSGAHYNCAVTRYQGTKCWGWNGDGNFGNYKADKTNATPVPAFTRITSRHLGQGLSFGYSGQLNQAGDTLALNGSATSALPLTYDTWTPDTCTVTGTTVTALKLGLCGLRASQGGGVDGAGQSWAPAPQQLMLIQIGAPLPTTTVVTAENATHPGQPFVDGDAAILTATVSSGSATPDGTITFTRAVSTTLPALTLCLDVPVANGVAKCNVPANALPAKIVPASLGVGNVLEAYHLRADYFGGPTFQDSSSEVVLPIRLRAKIVLRRVDGFLSVPITDPFTTTVNSPVTIEVGFEPVNNNGTPTSGVITLGDGQKSCSFNYSPGGFDITGHPLPVLASCSYTPTVEGVYTLAVHYVGDGSFFGPADSDPVTEIVAGPSGLCGADNGQTLLAAPANLCYAGNASGVSGDGHPWNWTCSAAGTGGSDANCSATIKQWTVKASSNSGGAITPASQPVDNGKVATLLVSAASGYHTASVSGCGGSLSADGKTYTTGAITADCAVTATFMASPVNGVCGGDNNLVLLAAPANLCTAGAASAVSGNGHPWAWSCAGTNNGGTANCSATIKQWAVTASSGSGGAITPASQNIDNGKPATLTVTPASGYSIATVTDNCGANGTNSGSLGADGKTYTTGAVIADCAVSATFNANPVNGVCGGDDGQVLLVAPTNLCSAGSASAVSGSGHPWTWRCMGTNSGATANCSATIKTWNVTASAAANGSISPASQPVDNGRTTTLSVTATQGYSAVVNGCGGSLSADGKTYTTGVIAADCAVSATFIANPVNGVCGSDNDQTLLAAPANLCAGGNASVVSGSGHPWSWTCGGINGGGNANCSATIKTWMVTANADANGSVTPASQNVDNGKMATFAVSANRGYSAGVSPGACGGNYATDGTYTTAPIQADCAFRAIFTPIAKLPTTTTLNLAPNPAVVNQQVTAVVHASTATGSSATHGVAVESVRGESTAPRSSLAAASGSVIVSGGGQSCTATLADGSGSCVLAFATAGIYAITASYSGDANNLPSSDTQNLAVNAVITQQAVPAPALSVWMLALLAAALAGFAWLQRHGV